MSQVVVMLTRARTGWPNIELYLNFILQLIYDNLFPCVSFEPRNVLWESRQHQRGSGKNRGSRNVELDRNSIESSPGRARVAADGISRM